MSVKERLKEFINYKGISVRSFEAKCGFSYGYIANMRVSMQPEKVTSIAERYPELNTGWLLTGEGDTVSSLAASIAFSRFVSLTRTKTFNLIIVFIIK